MLDIKITELVFQLDDKLHSADARLDVAEYIKKCAEKCDSELLLRLKVIESLPSGVSLAICSK